MCLQWTTTGSAEKTREIRKKREDKDAMAAGEWLGLISSQSIVGFVHFAWAYIAVRPSTTKLL